MNTNKISRGFIFTQLFSGAGMGLLVGIIVGISVSPTVKVILGALAALLATFLGIQDSRKNKNDEEVDNNKTITSGLRAGSFGIMCVAGILLGIFLRTNGVLGESIKDQIAEWQDAGFDSTKARELVVYKNLAIKPKDWEIAPETAVHRGASPYAFADETKGICDKIRFSKNGNEVKYTLTAYEKSGENFKHFADIIRSIDDPGKQKELLVAFEEVICNLETKK